MKYFWVTFRRPILPILEGSIFIPNHIPFVWQEQIKVIIKYFRAPPVICGFNTGQHMWVPASDQCNQININIDTANTGPDTVGSIKNKHFLMVDERF